jgi:LysM domain
MYNPLVIFTGAAIATLAALLGVTYDRWSATAHDQIAAAGKETKSAPAQGKLQDMAWPGRVKEPPPEKTDLASIDPRDSTAPGPSQPADAADAVPEDSKPTFDTVRIERDGSAVIAGRGLPESDVTVILNGSPLGSVKADVEGAWVFVPEQPVPPGDHQLTLRMNRPGDLAINSEQSVALKVPERLGEQALVVLSDASQPSKVLQTPEIGADETTAAEPEASGAEQQAHGNLPSSMELTLGTVDYDDAGEIIFSGRAEPGTSVRLYVDNRPVGDAPVAAEGTWSFAGNETIAPGSHSLRVDQIQRSGSVSKRIELPFVRATPQDVASLNQATSAEPLAENASDEPKQEAADQPAEPASSENLAGVPGSSADSTPAAAEENQTIAVTNAESGTAASTMATEAAAGPADTLISADSASAEANLPRNGKVVIQPGNSLWRISRVIYGRGIEYTVIYQANKDHIRNPDLIYPGQIFATPGVMPPETIDPKTTAPLANTTSSPTSQQ